MYIADQYNNRVRMIAAATGIITTVAGNGTEGYSGDGGAAMAAQLYRPAAVALDGSGNLYITDEYNHCVRRVSAVAGVITTIAGDGTAGDSGDGGPATAARLDQPWGIGVDAAGHVYVTDHRNSRIRRIAAGTGVMTTVAGSATGYGGENAPATTARFFYPAAVAVDPAGNVYIADSENRRVRKLIAATGLVVTIAGSGTQADGGDNGQGPAAQLNRPAGVAVDAFGHVYIAAGTLDLDCQSKCGGSVRLHVVRSAHEPADRTQRPVGLAPLNRG